MPNPGNPGALVRFSSVAFGRRDSGVKRDSLALIEKVGSYINEKFRPRV
jgi:hypothetical protein